MQERLLQKPPEKILDNIRLGIFDWSGVISDDRIPVHESNMRMLEKRGIHRFSLSEWLLISQQSPREFFLNQGVTTNPEEIFKEYECEYQKVVDEGILPTVYPDALSTTNRLHQRGIKLAVVSSHPEKVLIEESSRYKILDCFEIIIAGAKDKSLEIVNLSKKVGIPISESFYVGDTVFDVRSAKKAGTRSVAISSGYHGADKLLAEDPDFLIERLSDIISN